MQHAEAELKTASEEFADYFSELVAERRIDLRNDLLSELIRARDEDVFSEQELLSTILLLIIAGHKTVANMIGNGTALLLRHPEQLAMLRANPGTDSLGDRGDPALRRVGRLGLTAGRSGGHAARRCGHTQGELRAPVAVQRWS